DLQDLRRPAPGRGQPATVRGIGQVKRRSGRDVRREPARRPGTGEVPEPCDAPGIGRGQRGAVVGERQGQDRTPGPLERALPVAGSQTTTAASLPPVASVRPSGAKARAVTLLAWASHSAWLVPGVSASQRRTSPPK